MDLDYSYNDNNWELTEATASFVKEKDEDDNEEKPKVEEEEQKVEEKEEPKTEEKEEKPKPEEKEKPKCSSNVAILSAILRHFLFFFFRKKK